MNYTKGERKVYSVGAACLVNTDGMKNIGTFKTEADAILDAAAPLGYELAKFTSLVSATWIEEGKLEIGEGDYLRMKQLALEFLAKAEGKEEKDVLSV